jgi:predicted membrane protein
MSARILRSVEALTLLISIVVTILVMHGPSRWGAGLNPGRALFMCWVVSPYVIFFGFGIVMERLTAIPQTPLIACVVSLLMLAFTLMAYVGTLGDKSSTYALIFLFVPYYLYAGSFGILVGALVAVRVFERRRGGSD